MVVGFCGWTKESARFLLFECPCPSSQLVNPFPLSKRILPGGDRTQKLLLGLLGQWEGLDTTEGSKCLIATNFNRSCPKYTLEDTYQRQILLKGIALRVDNLLSSCQRFCKRFNSSIFFLPASAAETQSGGGLQGWQKAAAITSESWKGKSLCKGICYSSFVIHWCRTALYISHMLSGLSFLGKNLLLAFALSPYCFSLHNPPAGFSKCLELVSPATVVWK